MKSLISNPKVASIVIGGLLIANIILVFSVLRSDQEALIQQEQNAIITEAKTEAKLIAQTVDERGYSKAVFERKNSYVGNGDISKLPVSQTVIDSLRLDNITKEKRLKQADLIAATLEAKNLRATKVIDSLMNTYYVYNDDFTTAKFIPDSNGGNFDIEYRIKLIKQDYTKKTWLLGAKKNYTDILSPDKRITINGLNSMSFESAAKSRFGLSVMAGYAYDFNEREFKPAVGLGLSYQIARF